MKILIIRFSSIGDIILTSPVLRCLKQQLNDSEIHFAAKAQFKDLLVGNPHITKVHLLEDDLSELTHHLKRERFDVVVDLHNSVRSRFVRRRLSSRTLIVKKLNVQKWVMVRFKRIKNPLRHFAERCLDAVTPLGVKNDGHGLEFVIRDEDQVELASLPPSHRAGYVAMGIGARHFTKKLPLDKLISVCHAIQHPIILLGDHNDSSIAEQVAAACGDKIFNACSRYTINQTASLLQRARVVISHDSAVMHLAAALRKPIVSIWGNTVPEFGMYPYFSQESPTHPLSMIIQVNGLSCRPCSKLGYRKCPKGHFKCMKDIPEGSVSSAVNTFWPEA